MPCVDAVVKSRVLLLLALLICAQPALPDTVYRVGDLNAGTVPQDSDPRRFTILGSDAYFFARARGMGMELWKSDGNLTTQLVKDIEPGLADGVLSDIVPVVSNGKMFFVGLEETSGEELWVTDGTTAGTQLVKDICPGSCGALIRSLTDVNGTLFFTALDPVNGQELWKSDGTAANTVAVTTFSNANPSFNHLTNVNGTLYLAADDGTQGLELWKSNGTNAGTVIVEDIYAGSQSSNPGSFLAIGNTLYFAAETAAEGRELWKSTGTAAGTAIIEDINPGSASSDPEQFMAAGTVLLFSAYDPTIGREIWTSYGSGGSGTYRTRDDCSGTCSGNPTLFGKRNTNVYYTVSNGTGREVRFTDGVVSTKAADLPNSNATVLGAVQFGTELLFLVSDPSAGIELWKTSGTPAAEVEQLSTDPADIPSGAMIALTPAVLFAAEDGTNGEELWRSDGSAAGTYLYSNLYTDNASSSPRELTPVFEQTAIFSADTGNATGRVWKSDGSYAGTLLANSDVVQSQGFLKLTDFVMFAGSTPTHGYELWTSSAAGTSVLDVVAGTDGLGPQNIGSTGGSPGTPAFALFSRTVFDGFFTTFELWKSNGTVAGTQFVKSFFTNTGIGSLSKPVGLVDYGYFVFEDDVTKQLHKSNGTSAGTVFVSGVGVDPIILRTLGFDLLVFSCTAPSSQCSLVKLNGANGETTFLKTFNGFGTPCFVADAPGYVYFIADDGVHGKELWRTNGTADGTVLVHDANPGSADGVAGFGVGAYLGGYVYFAATEGTNGIELWRTNTAGVGASRFLDLCSNACSSDPKWLLAFNNKVYFQANNGSNGEELYWTDGTSTVLTDLYNSGSRGSGARPLGSTQSILYLSADDGLGTELHAICLNAADVDVASPGYANVAGVTQVPVRPVDALGGPTPCFTGTVQMSTSDGAASFTPSNNWIFGDGTKSIPMTFNTLGQQTVTAQSGAMNDTASIFVGPSLAHTNILEELTTVVANGSAYSEIYVQYRNGQGATMNTNAGVQPVLSTTRGTIQDLEYTGNGVYMAKLRSTTIGAATVSGTIQGFPIADTATVTFVHGSLFSFSISAPTTVNPNTPFNVVVTALDQSGHVVTDFSGSVTLSVSAPTSSLPVSYQFQAGDQGVHTFTGVTVSDLGDWNLHVTDNGSPFPHIGNRAVSVRYATTTAIGSSPHPSASGQQVTITATVTAAQGGTPAGTVTFTIDGLSQYPVTLVNGSASFSAAFSSGTHQFQITYNGSSTHGPSTSSVRTHYVILPAPAKPAAMCPVGSFVQISWATIAGSSSYNIYRKTGNQSFSYVGNAVTSGGTGSYTDFTTSPATAYLYQITAIDAGGFETLPSESDLAITVSYLESLTAGFTTIKTSHVQELRNAVNALRIAAGLGASSFTDPTLSSSVLIKADHVLELRAARDQAYSEWGLPSHGLSELAITAGTTIVRKSDIDFLRQSLQ